MGEDFSKLKRPKQAMPGYVKQALKKRELLEAYKKRPAYQQNDYLSWISDGKLQDIKLERLEQMLNELDKGGIYMAMEYLVSEKKNVTTQADFLSHQAFTFFENRKSTKTQE